MNLLIHLLGYVQSVLQIAILIKIFGHSIKPLYVLTFPAVAAIINGMLFHSLGMWSATVIYYLLFAVFFFGLCKINPLQTLLLIASQMALTAIVELTSNTVLGFMGRNIFYSLRSEYAEYLRIRAVGTIFLAAIFSLVMVFRKSITVEAKSKRVLWFLVTTFSILAMLIYPNVIYIYQGSITVPNFLWIYNLVVILLIVAYGIYAYIDLDKASKHAEQLEVEQVYNAALRQANENLRDFRHDMDNFRSSAEGYIRAGDHAGLLTLLSSAENDLAADTANDLSRNLAEVPFLFGLLLKKISDAEQENVNLQISAGVIPAAALNIDPIDCCRIVGGLLDNAIEAAATSSTRSVIVELHSLDGYTYIHITNTVSGEVDITKIYIRGETSKAGHSGIGLHRTAKTIKKYQKRNPHIKLETRYAPGEFHQTLRV